MHKAVSQMSCFHELTLFTSLVALRSSSGLNQHSVEGVAVECLERQNK